MINQLTHQTHNGLIKNPTLNDQLTMPWHMTAVERLGMGGSDGRARDEKSA